MLFLVAILPLILIALAGARLFRRSICETFAPSLFLTALIVYLCGLLGLLAVSPFVIVVLSVVLFVFSWIRVKKMEDKTAVEPIFSVGLLLILIAAVSIVLFTRGRMVTDMDSFEQWAFVVKKMYLTNSLQSAIGQYATTALYPPGIALLEYYFMRFSPVFQESILFSAKNILAFSLLLPLFRHLERKQWKNVLLVGGVALIFPFLEYASFDVSLEVDALLGLLFGWVLMQGTDKKQIDLFSLISLALGGFLLSMTKVSGIVFVIIATMILLFFHIWNNTGTRKVKQSNARHQILLTAMLLLGGIIGVSSWYLFVRSSGVIAASASLPSFRGGFQPYQKETIVNFMQALFANSGSGLSGLSPIAWLFAVPLLGALAVRFIDRDELFSRRVVPLSLLLCLGYFVWLLSLLIGYLTSFIPEEAVSLAAFGRYLSSYQIGALLLVLSWLIGASHTRGVLFSRRFLALLVSLLAIFAPLDRVFFATLGSPYQNDKSVEFQAQYAPSSRYYAELIEPNTKICYLDQTEQEPGYSFALFQFEALPVQVGKAIAWRLGKPYYETDYYSATPTSAEWEKALIDGAFTHLYLRNTNPYFEQVYGSLFVDSNDIQADSYYEIMQQDGHVQLIRILL